MLKFLFETNEHITDEIYFHEGKTVKLQQIASQGIDVVHGSL